MDRQTFKKLFIDTDDGQVLGVHVFATSRDDWQKLLDFLASAYRCTYTDDGLLVEAIPRYETIAERRNTAMQLIKVDLAGASINSHFFETESIEFDLLPREVGDPEKADLVVDLMKAISRLLSKDVFLNEENNSASDELLKEEALAWIDNRTGRLNVFD